MSRDARTPVKQLAKEIHLSPSATSRRIAKLEERGILLGTHPRIDNSKLGYTGYRTYCNFLGTTPEEENDVFEWLDGQDAVSVLAHGNGYDIILMSWVEQYQVYDQFLARFREQYRSHIADLVTHRYVKTVNYTRDYLVDEDDTFSAVTGGNEPVDHDELDRDILREFVRAGREPALSISQSLDEPAKTVANRIRRLERKGVIKGYGINLDVEALGRTYYKLNFIFHETFSHKELLNYAKQLPSAIYVDVAFSPYDFELNVEVSDRDELRSIIDEVKELTGGIRALDTFTVHEYRKLSYVSF